jgi:hypothetical protein
MRELSDGTLRPATESEAARALRAVGRSETPSIAPKRPGSGSALASASSLGTRQVYPHLVCGTFNPDVMLDLTVPTGGTLL